MRLNKVCILAAVLGLTGFAFAQEETVPLMRRVGGPGLHQFDESPAGPEAKKELSIKREEVFDFATPPAITRNGDHVDITFETKGFCDATVVIEDATGKIIRHLATGVLGDNAPAPFEKNSKKQHLVWDGKDDFGVFIDDKDAMTVRVSLGLEAHYEKSLHASPLQFLGPEPIFHAAPEGVYVYSADVNHAYQWIELFDHDGHYLKTIFPFVPSVLDKVKGLNWVYAWPDQKKIPAKFWDLHGSVLPFVCSLYDIQPACGDFSVLNGWINMDGRPNFVRFKADGGTDGHDLVGPESALSVIKKTPIKSMARRMTPSPDGKWIYLTRAFGSRNEGGSADLAHMPDNAVYRMPADQSEAPKVFIGDPNQAGSDNAHFNTPSSIACDPQGRIYVTDWDNDRLQIFSPDGKYLKTIQSLGPTDVAVNQKTGDVYVFSWLLRWKVYGYAAEIPQIWRRGEGQDGDYNLRGTPLRVRKLSPFDDGLKQVYEEPLLYNGKALEKNETNGPITRITVDGWAAHPTIWISLPIREATHTAIYEEVDNKLNLVHDFDKELAAAGIQTANRISHHPSPLQRQFLFFDPKHQTLYVGEPNELQVKYFSSLLAINIKTGREQIIKLPMDTADAGIDAFGRIYLLSDDVIGRFDLETWREVPFDYGRKFGKTGDIVSVEQTIGGHWSSYKHQSLGVSPRGDVIVAGYKSPQGLDLRAGKKAEPAGTPWHPQVYPGRPGFDICVTLFNSYGELMHEDVLQGIGAVTGGLHLDFADNIYAAIPAASVLDGRPVKWNTGTLARFSSEGGRFLTDGKSAMAPLDKVPDGPAPLKDDAGQNLWPQGAQWLFGGTPNGLLWQNCNCRQARFTTDYFGRSFVPESWRYDVAVIDPAGNVVTRIGQYGNFDSTGPKSLVPLGGDEAGLMDCQFVAVDTDRRLFMGDEANARIVSATLDYHTQQRIALKEIPDEAKK